MGNEKRVKLISLGCDKNRVDSEVMLGLLHEAGFVLTQAEDKADILIVNTCGFISEAVQESIDTLLSAAEHKKNGTCRALIVTGCMVQRYREELLREIPEVDDVLGVNEYPQIVAKARALVGDAEVSTTPAASVEDESLFTRRLTDGLTHVAYVKIAEGCDNRCAYCAIPAIRGPYRSRPMDGILAECRGLIARGARELVLVAQDTARYGEDRPGEPRLPELIRAIAALEGLVWLRLMYAYPEHITPALIQALAETPKVCHYLDMPIQHSHDAVLQRMGRQSTHDGLKALIGKLRAQIPDIVLRTTLMVGFPGETDAEFDALYRFVQDTRFDRLGVFMYSREDGTPAARMKPQVKGSVKKKRRDALMTLQQTLHSGKQCALTGETLRVMVDAQVAAKPNGEFTYSGRSYRDAYEVDAVVILTARALLTPGDIVDVTVSGCDEYDLYGVCAHESAQ